MDMKMRAIISVWVCILVVLPSTAFAQLVSLASHKGQVVYLDFWASWCTPCKASFPFMNELHGQLAGQGLVVLAVNLDEQRAAADRFLQQTPARFRIAYDPKGLTPEQYKVKAMPTAVLIDRKGQVRHVHAGFRDRDRDALRAQVESLLKETLPKEAP
jgi:thiol-disulfide isomerase/thioredoxin